MNIIIWSLVIFIFICVGYLLTVKYAPDSLKEHFSAPTGLEETVIQAYKDILQREPTASEMIQATRDINGNKITSEGLRQRLIDSDEYARMVKLQSNSLTPELPKIISDRALIQRISDIYMEERKQKIPEKVILPLKDTYVSLNYNEFAFRALLRSEQYTTFEEDVSGASELDKETLGQLVEKTFDKKALQEEGVKIAEEIKVAAAASAAGAAGVASDAGGTGVASDAGVAGVSDAGVRTVNDQDSSMSPMVDGIMQSANRVFDKDEYAKMLDIQQQEMQIPVQTHYGQMALRPDLSWTVPQHPPPVCTTLGQKPLIQPVMTNSKLLLGTPLDDAEDTEVGSIMPKFEYKEYIGVNVKEDASPPVVA